VHLGQGDLATRVGDARLLVGVVRRGHHFGKRREVVVGVDEAGTVAGDDRHSLHVERLVSKA
jgi:hypothetical protein